MRLIRSAVQTRLKQLLYMFSVQSCHALSVHNEQRFAFAFFLWRVRVREHVAIIKSDFKMILV